MNGLMSAKTRGLHALLLAVGIAETARQILENRPWNDLLALFYVHHKTEIELRVSMFGSSDPKYTELFTRATEVLGSVERATAWRHEPALGL
jgi:hypothetical protein